MLDEGVAGTPPAKSMDQVDQSQVLGAMALHLKKEKSYREAAIYEAMSALAWDRGMLDQRRKPSIDQVSLERKIRNLLAKTDAPGLADAFWARVEAALRAPRKTTPWELKAELADISRGR